ncbi:sodium/glutamate symporter [Neiella sp. HB171785]|uniref:Sodium/glutamate symporter n=1 Tax=Neiella litorisoli TaxID=2771431 RepID=A0A8J6R243_9GAMM|nr:sodium/glutamate symporter [Neiella litorisoli]MBD1388555.1 sodium/glutamate symporter [Neiella litorisoli]
METLQVHGFVAFTLTIVLLFIGKVAIMRYQVLRAYSIPEPVIGGFLCAIVVALIYAVADIQVNFELDVRDWLLLYFFAGIGLRSDIKTLLSGGKPLAILVLLAVIYIILQNLIGIGAATGFGLDPKTGLMAGSISLIGGVGTTLAWAPTFVEDLGITNGMEIGVAANTIGLISACCLGGPIASYLIKKHKLKTGSHDDLDVGVAHDKTHTKIEHYAILWAWMWLNVALIMGHFLDLWLTDMGAQLPKFVSCLIAGIFIRNAVAPLFPKLRWPGQEQGLALISDICLGMFLTMALMSLQIWELKGSLLFLGSVMTLQILLSVVFTIFVVFKVMGKDYEATVICSGFGGITLGSTATAIANMTAVSHQHGAAHRAFIVVPLVCGFFVDIVNAIIISFFVGL